MQNLQIYFCNIKQRHKFIRANFEILQEFRLKIIRFVLKSSFRIEWCKNFQEHVTDLKNTVDYKRLSFFSVLHLY